MPSATTVLGQGKEDDVGKGMTVRLRYAILLLCSFFNYVIFLFFFTASLLAFSVKCWLE